MSNVINCRYVIHKNRDNVLNLGLSLPAGGQCISSANVVMFHHHSWEVGGETWGGEKGGQMPAITPLLSSLQASLIMFICTILWQ